MIPVAPSGLIGISFVFIVGRSSAAFHNLPIVYRPYGAEPTGVLPKVTLRSASGQLTLASFFPYFFVALNTN